MWGEEALVTGPCLQVKGSARWDMCLRPILSNGMLVLMGL